MSVLCCEFCLVLKAYTWLQDFFFFDAFYDHLFLPIHYVGFNAVDPWLPLSSR